MEMFDDFHCFAWVMSRGWSCSRNFMQNNVLSVRHELEFFERGLR